MHCSEGISLRARRSWPWHPDSYSVTVCECHAMNSGKDPIASCIVGGVTCAAAVIEKFKKWQLQEVHASLN